MKVGPSESSHGDYEAQNPVWHKIQDGLGWRTDKYETALQIEKNTLENYKKRNPIWSKIQEKLPKILQTNKYKEAVQDYKDKEAPWKSKHQKAVQDTANPANAQTNFPEPPNAPETTEPTEDLTWFKSIEPELATAKNLNEFKNKLEETLSVAHLGAKSYELQKRILSGLITKLNTDFASSPDSHDLGKKIEDTFNKNRNEILKNRLSDLRIQSFGLDKASSLKELQAAFDASTKTIKERFGNDADLSPGLRQFEALKEAEKEHIKRLELLKFGLDKANSPEELNQAFYEFQDINTAQEIYAQKLEKFQFKLTGHRDIQDLKTAFEKINGQICSALSANNLPLMETLLKKAREKYVEELQKLNFGLDKAKSLEELNMDHENRKTHIIAMFASKENESTVAQKTLASLETQYQETQELLRQNLQQIEINNKVSKLSEKLTNLENITRAFDEQKATREELENALKEVSGVNGLSEQEQIEDIENFAFIRQQQMTIKKANASLLPKSKSGGTQSNQAIEKARKAFEELQQKGRDLLK